MSADRGTVVAEIEARVANENLRRHMLATEAIMRALAVRLGEDA
ncbi:MAG: phosphohydrolase, partial [Thermoleophilia bacterium]|nr:phosphohydrolase [Thermoleophilia bacterium]